MNIQVISLFLATMSTGLMAGIFFTWTNAVTPGIGKLRDLEYLRALQAMNRVILNPVFYIVFTAPVLSLPLATIFYFDSEYSMHFILLMVASLIYLAGSFLITILGNIPLNNVLHRNNLVHFSVQEASHLRGEIETKWNAFNLIRAITSFIAFIILLITCLIITI